MFSFMLACSSDDICPISLLRCALLIRTPVKVAQKKFLFLRITELGAIFQAWNCIPVFNGCAISGFKGNSPLYITLYIVIKYMEYNRMGLRTIKGLFHLHIFSNFQKNYPSRFATQAICITLKIQVKSILDCAKAPAILFIA